MAPETPQYIPPIAGSTTAGGDSGITMEDKFRGIKMASEDTSDIFKRESANTNLYWDCATTSNGDKFTLSINADGSYNFAPPRAERPVDRGYYARTFGGKQRK